MIPAGGDENSGGSGANSPMSIIMNIISYISHFYSVLLNRYLIPGS